MLEKIKTPAELANFLSVDPDFIKTIDPTQYYHVFDIPKPGSAEKRRIETPSGLLRKLLDPISNELQEMYRYCKTDAAYGFIRCGRYDTDKRNILTNARKHLGKKFLLNIDLDNFFYQVDTQKVKNIFSDFTHFQFDVQTEVILTRLVTFKSRLPMGSPTSPPLSNFATIALDNDLLNWAKQNHFSYTRYVDDLSFSSNMQISNTHFEAISEILISHRFAPDPKKIKWYGKCDRKEITGLLLEDKITIPKEFYKEFDNELAKFKEVWIMAHQYPDHHAFEWINKLTQMIHGRLAFISMIYNRYHPLYRQYQSKFVDIKHSDESELSCSWRYAGYEF